eukprot:1158696-Pelagomonas_calceolata.AAC.4
MNGKQQFWQGTQNNSSKLEWAPASLRSGRGPSGGTPTDSHMPHDGGRGSPANTVLPFRTCLILTLLSKAQVSACLVHAYAHSSWRASLL